MAVNAMRILLSSQVMFNYIKRRAVCQDHIRLFAAFASLISA